MRELRTRRAAEIDRLETQPRWLIDGLWADQAVGVIGGEPKSFKSFLALELAVAVAAGSSALGCYPARQSGPVLLFAGEDALHIVRQRLEGITCVREVDFTTLDVHVIIEPSLRIDLDEPRERLRRSLERLRPRLLILDPFIRTHRADENVVAEVAPLLAYLREFQREFHTAVLLVHHARKAHHARPGQALRGSSEIHAWLDSALYLRRKDEQVTLTIEHRAVAAPPPLRLQLETTRGVALRVQAPPHDPEPPTSSPRERIVQALAQADAPLSQRALREAARVRATTVGEVLAELIAEKRAWEAPGGYLATPPPERPLP